ncbi:MAG: hypothetical protein A2351_03675 [Omnitrophica bacterium RIFOXYB12_FULL_50_7]|nr:MAG: hypothetical protein A2351_03675 [Omnitrophica bacterium RIFOXYB12_FULL_50_7]
MEADSLRHFKENSRKCFRFLIDEFQFLENPSPKDSHNQYEVIYFRNDLMVGIRGEGYGSIASVYFRYQGKREVPLQFLFPGWEPLLRKKKIKKELVSQDEQIRIASEQMKANCADILNGDMTRYLEVFNRWESICQKMGYK